MDKHKSSLHHSSQTIGFPNSFDFLRLFAAVSVVIVHATTFLGASLFIINDDWLFSDGVPLFFVLSGFLVYNSFEKCVKKNKPKIQFFRNRFLRIAPAIYFYTIVITILLFTLGYFSISNFSFKWLISNLILVPVDQPAQLKSFGVGALNGSLWTIPVEVSFYFLIPILYAIEKRYGAKIMTIVLLVLTVVGKELLLLVSILGYSGTLLANLYSSSFMPNLWHFALGIIMLKYWGTITRFKKLELVFLACLILYIGLKFVRIDSNDSLEFIIDFLSGIPLSFMAIWLGYCLPKYFYLLTNKIGDLSYGIYIWHMPIINIIIYLNINKIFRSGTFLLFLVLFVTFIVAYISWNLIEKPALKLKNYSVIEKKTI